MSIFFGFLAGLVAILNVLFFSNHPFFQSLHLNLYGLHFFCLYLFFERLISKKPNLIRFSIMVGLLVMLTIALWLVYYSKTNSITISFLNYSLELNSFTGISWVIADFSYWTPAFIVYLGLGVPIYIKTYLYTKEKKPVVLAIALLFVGFGFIITFLVDLIFILNFFNINIDVPNVILVLSNLNNVFQLIGIMLFVIVYLINIDYIYRLPSDTYILMVLKEGGIPVHTIHLKTRNEVEIKEFLLSGMITAINNLFMEITKNRNPIQNILSQGINVLVQTGKEITAVLLTENISYFLNQGLKRYVKVFEKEFSKELECNEENVHEYDRGVKILESVFPFFIIEDKKGY
jgi:hypothetical protein